MIWWEREIYVTLLLDYQEQKKYNNKYKTEEKIVHKVFFSGFVLFLESLVSNFLLMLDCLTIKKIVRFSFHLFNFFDYQKK